MLHRPTRNLQTPFDQQKQVPVDFFDSKYGITLYDHSDERQRLLAIPSELLTHITSFLDPPSLLALSRVCKALRRHVKEDNTWHRAFVSQCFGVGSAGEPPSCDAQLGRGLLRRFAQTWRGEFIHRYNTKRRWEGSCNRALTYSPIDASISKMHLMTNHQPPALLTSSLQFGAVVRSLPLTGKALKGHFDALGTEAAIGNGVPVGPVRSATACAMCDESLMVRIAWGFENGQVAVTTAPRAMATGNQRGGIRNARFILCREADSHVGAVSDAVWGTGVCKSVFLTGSADGIKLWDATTVGCLWASGLTPGLATDPIVKVALGFDGIVAAAQRSGDLLVYTGMEGVARRTASPKSTIVTETRVLSPATSARASNVGGAEHECISLHVCVSASYPVFLAAFKSRPYVYRIAIPGFGDHRGQFGNDSSQITCVATFFSHSDRDASQGNYVFTGDQLGSISVFDWDAHYMDSCGPPHAPNHTFHAHDSPVTALAQGTDSVVLISGSADGEVKVWDLLTFVPLRTFSSPAALLHNGDDTQRVEHIVACSDMFVASSGSRILAWKAGKLMASGRPKYGGSRSGGLAGKVRSDRENAKYHQLEIQQSLVDLRNDLEQEQALARRAYGRRKEHLGELERLGLDEEEVVAYVLMLSRDEGQQTLDDLADRSPDDGVFQGEFDEVAIQQDRPSSSSTSGSCSSSPYLSGSSDAQTFPGVVPGSTEARTTLPIPVLLPTAADFPPISPGSSKSLTVPSTPSAHKTSLASSVPGSLSPSNARGGGGTWSGIVSRSGSRSDISLSNSAGRQGAKVDGDGDDDDDEGLGLAMQLSLMDFRNIG